MDVYGHLFDSTGDDLTARMTALMEKALSNVVRLASKSEPA
jgi:hypothetical protein